MSDLEADVGFALFERHGGRVEATPEAREFILEVERMFYSLDRLRAVAREVNRTVAAAAGSGRL